MVSSSMAAQNHLLSRGHLLPRASSAPVSVRRAATAVRCPVPPLRARLPQLQAGDKANESRSAMAYYYDLSSNVDELVIRCQRHRSHNLGPHSLCIDGRNSL